MKYKVGDYVIFSNEFRTHNPDVEKDNIARKIRYIDAYGRYTLEGLPNNSFYKYELELAEIKATNLTINTTENTINIEYKSTPIKFNIMPERYIINKGATVLFWADGTKTIVKRSKDDDYNKRLGFLTAYFQKTSGMSKSKANKYLDSLIEEGSNSNESSNSSRKIKRKSKSRTNK